MEYGLPPPSRPSPSRNSFHIWSRTLSAFSLSVWWFYSRLGLFPLSSVPSTSSDLFHLSWIHRWGSLPWFHFSFWTRTLFSSGHSPIIWYHTISFLLLLIGSDVVSPTGSPVRFPFSLISSSTFGTYQPSTKEPALNLLSIYTRLSCRLFLSWILILSSISFSLVPSTPPNWTSLCKTQG